MLEEFSYPSAQDTGEIQTTLLPDASLFIGDILKAVRKIRKKSAIEDFLHLNNDFRSPEDARGIPYEEDEDARGAPYDFETDPTKVIPDELEKEEKPDTALKRVIEEAFKLFSKNKNITKEEVYESITKLEIKFPDNILNQKANTTEFSYPSLKEKAENLFGVTVSENLIATVFKENEIKPQIIVDQEKREAAVLKAYEELLSKGENIKRKGISDRANIITEKKGEDVSVSERSVTNILSRNGIDPNFKEQRKRAKEERIKGILNQDPQEAPDEVTKPDPINPKGKKIQKSKKIKNWEGYPSLFSLLV